jgi:hypothetical protein
LPFEASGRETASLALSFAEDDAADYNSLCRAPGDRDMNKHFLSRRRFNALCASVGLSLPAAGTIGGLSSTSVFAVDAPTRTVKLRNGAVVPAVGHLFSRRCRLRVSDVYEFLEGERIKSAIRLPANRDRIGYLLKRPIGRPPNEVRRFHANFTC